MRSYLLIFFIFSAPLIYGQKNYILTFSNQNHVTIKKNTVTNFTDSIQAKNYVTNLQLTAIGKGYLLASIDTITYLTKEMKVSIYLGPKFGKANLILSNEDLHLLKQYIGINEKFYTG